MDARLRNLFVSRRGHKHDQHQLRAQPYESTVKQQSPTTGTRPIAGNGPYRLENVALQAPGRGAGRGVAEAPTVPRSRPDSYSYRPQTAPQTAQWDRSWRARSNISTETLMDYSRYASSYRPAPSTTQRGRSISALPTPAVRYRNHSAHIDILDAVTQINPSPRIFIQKTIASGKRDYGEDVADRNISEYGGVEFPQHDAYSASDDDEMQSQDGPAQVENDWGGSHWPESRSGVNSRDRSIRSIYPENDEVGDDTALQTQRTTDDIDQIGFRAKQNTTIPAPPTAVNSHTRRQYGSSTTYSADGKPGASRPGWSSSASADAALCAAVAPLSNASLPTDPYAVSGGSKSTASTSNDAWEAAKKSQSASSIQRSLESRGTQTTPPPSQSTASPSVSEEAFSTQEREDSDADWYNQSTTRSRLSRRVILPTPPMSPTNGGSPTTSISRASLDKELPPPPPNGNSTSGPVSHSQGGSIRSSALPPQEFGRSLERARLVTNRTLEADRLGQQPNDKISDEHYLKTSSVRPRLEDVVDTRNTTDTEVIRTQSPAIVHEYVVPKVHHINERRISREIHNHDVFHRIQPIIDVEVLPTKHYIPTADGKGLIEILDTQLPGRHTNWTVQPTEDKLGKTASADPGSIKRFSSKSVEYLSRREPRMQDSQRTLTNDGVLREETVWRHPPQLENGARETGQTVPLHINHDSEENIDGVNDAASEKYAPSDPYAGSEKTFSTNADGEEELLFRDSDLAFDGRLPGLEEANPVVDVNLSASRPSTATTRRGDDLGEGEATSALRRMHESKLANKMGRLSIAAE